MADNLNITVHHERRLHDEWLPFMTAKIEWRSWVD